MGLYYGTSPVGTITTNGSSTAYNTTSDERLKNWSVSQRDYEQVIRQLWVGDFLWKASGRADFGIRAQQAYGLFPEAISKPENDNGQWQADYGKLAPLALWGVKDLYKSVDKQEDNLRKQTAIVEDLKKKVVALSVQIALLTRKIASVERDTSKKVARN